MTENTRPAQPNMSLCHGIACLQFLAMADRPIGSREAARALGFEPTRANRLLGTLASLGIAEKTADQKYQAGPGLHVLAAQSLRGSRLLNVALPHLKPLLNQGLAVALGVLWRMHVCYLWYILPDQDPGQGIGASNPWPAWDSSIGRVLLAALPLSDARRLYLQEQAKPCKTCLEFKRNLNAIRRQGYAFIPKKAISGTTLGVPIGSPPVAGLAFCGNFSARSVPRLFRLLNRSATDISQELKSRRNS
ncbi:MAG: transcriptional regulator [Kiritimatiellaeota bacterium]|nr:transcriptional regulator [Kiritimatiellota bacterium]